ncbi:hypothetical protein AMTR_s00001p00073610 [Amborella trichopoda]|uniref:Uncharacterized protein n=1 Tax=Amborella trichopoda TaxID=13333 RepID=W1NLT0_AMBTC|nr:hypothetical protein AMTR_s00001p00073610 [Amborella trichopoda]
MNQEYPYGCCPNQCHGNHLGKGSNAKAKGFKANNSKPLILQILSNGVYKCVEHMARATSNTNRISIPIFVGPRPHTKIGPLPGILQKDGKPIYKDFLFGELMEYFFAIPHKGKQTALDFARF